MWKFKKYFILHVFIYSQIKLFSYLVVINFGRDGLPYWSRANTNISTLIINTY